MRKIKGILFDLEGALLAPGQASADSWKVAFGGLKAVRRLYDRGFRLGILSRRSGEAVLGWLRGEGLMQYFEAVQPFGTAGCRTACEKLGLEPAECALVTRDPAGEADPGTCILVAEEIPEGGYAVRRLADLPELPILE